MHSVEDTWADSAKNLDTDGDGVVSEDEFVTCLETLKAEFADSDDALAGKEQLGRSGIVQSALRTAFEGSQMMISAPASFLMRKASTRIASSSLTQSATSHRHRLRGPSDYCDKTKSENDLMRCILSWFDIDGSGSISSTEMSEELSTQHNWFSFADLQDESQGARDAKTQEAASAWVTWADQNDDEKVDVDEFKAAMRHSIL